MSFPRRDQGKRHRQLREREEDEPTPAAAKTAQRARTPGQHQEDGGPQDDPHPGQERGRDALVDHDLDPEVRDAPEDRHRRERHPRAAGSD